MATPQNKPTVGSIRPRLSTCRDIAIIMGLAVWGLYAGSGFLIPLTLALLVYVLIIAVADRVAGRFVPTWLANLIGIAVVLTGLFAVMFVLGNQATQFARAVPTYENQFDSAVNRVVALVGNDVTKFVRDHLVDIDMSTVARSAFGGATSFLNTFLLISLYVFFIMSERMIFRDKLRLAANDVALGRELSSMMEAISHSLQAYVGVKTFVSVLTSLISYAVFRWLGAGICRDMGGADFCAELHPLDRVDRGGGVPRASVAGAVRHHHAVSDHRAVLRHRAIHDRQFS